MEIQPSTTPAFNICTLNYILLFLIYKQTDNTKRSSMGNLGGALPLKNGTSIRMCILEHILWGPKCTIGGTTLASYMYNFGLPNNISRIFLA